MPLDVALFLICAAFALGLEVAFFLTLWWTRERE